MAKKIIIYFVLYIIFIIAIMYFLDLLFKLFGVNIDKDSFFHMMIFLIGTNNLIIYSVRYSRTDTLISKYLVYFSRGLVVFYQIISLLSMLFLISFRVWVIITVFVFLTFIVINFIFRKSKDEINKWTGFI